MNPLKTPRFWYITFSLIVLTCAGLLIIHGSNSLYISGPPEEKLTVGASYALYFKLPFVMSINVGKVIPQEYADVAIFDEQGNKKLMTAKEFDTLLRSAFNNKTAMQEKYLDSDRAYGLWVESPKPGDNPTIITSSVPMYCIGTESGTQCRFMNQLTDLEIATLLNERHREPALMTEALKRGITANDLPDPKDKRCIDGMRLCFAEDGGVYFPPEDRGNDYPQTK